MAEEQSPESKLYVKEEIEKVSKEFKEELEKVRSKTTKIISTFVIVVGLLTGLGIYGAVKNYVKAALSDTTIQNLTEDANLLHDKIVNYEKDASNLRDKIIEYEQQVGKFASKEELSNHTHTVTYSGKEIGTKYIKNQNRVNIPDGHIIVAAYADGAGTIFYHKKLEINAPK